MCAICAKFTSAIPCRCRSCWSAPDEKRLHTFEELRHATEGWLSATSENMTIHIDMTARKTAPFPPDIRARIQAVVDTHAAVPRPEGIGRKVAMPSKQSYAS